MASTSTSPSFEDHASETDLNDVPTEEEERQTDTSVWPINKHKKLQHMTEFHEEYQRVFKERASLHTIMKNRISHMNPPMPNMVCREEMQNATLEKDVVIEYITDAQGRRVKKLAPLLIKSEPDREHVHHIPSDNNLPLIPEANFYQKREVTINSYSKTISSESSSDDRTLTAKTEESSVSMEEPFEIMKKHTETCSNVTKEESNVTEIETALLHIASGLQSAAGAYMTLASHIHNLETSDIPQIITQIPPPPIPVPMPIRKALTIDNEKNVVNYMIHSEYELTKTSWSKLQKKYNVGRGRIYSILKGKSMPGGSQY